MKAILLRNTVHGASPSFRDRYRAEPLYREVVEEQGVEEAMVPVGGSFVQLLQPLGPESLRELTRWAIPSYSAEEIDRLVGVDVTELNTGEPVPFAGSRLGAAPAAREGAD